MSNDDEFYKAFVAERNRLITTKNDSTKSFDQAILTLSTALLGFSTTLIPKAADIVAAIILLGVFWLVQLGALLAILLSFRASRNALQYDIDVANKWFDTKTPPASHDNPLNKSVTRWNELATWTFLIGVILFLASAGATLLLQKDDPKPTATTTITKPTKPDAPAKATRKP